MYIDYSKWETFSYSLNTLRLDLNNPRIRYRGTDLNQSQILQYLIDYEKVYELAKKISEEGYFVGEEPIICIENDKKIVLEGNRRTAALKLLQDPNKFLSKTKAKTLLTNIKTNGFPVNRKLKCYIAPNRLLANPIIYERHQGNSLEKWKTGNQYTFVAEMFYEDGLTIEEICRVLNEKKSKILKPLKAYNLFIEGKKTLKMIEDISIDISDFDITNLERFYTFEDARKLIGVEFNDNTGGLLINLPEEEFRKRLAVVFKMLMDSENFSRKFNNTEDKKKLISGLKVNPDFDLDVLINENAEPVSVSNARRTNLEAKKRDVTTRKKPSSRKTKRTNPEDILFGRSLSLVNGKVNDMYRFLDELYKKSSNDTVALEIIGMSLRLLLEVAARVYFAKTDLQKADKDMVYKDFLKIAKNDLTLLQTENGFLSLTNDWINGKNSIEGLLGKYAHGNILVNKNDVITSSKIVGDILEHYFSK